MSSEVSTDPKKIKLDETNDTQKTSSDDARNTNKMSSDESSDTNKISSEESSEAKKIINTKYVKLNVGGYLYITTIDTLTKYDTMLKAMFSGNLDLITDSSGFVIIDRCGKHFGIILNYLRDGTVIPPKSKSDIEELLTEAKYYCIKSLTMKLEVILIINYNDNNCNKPFQWKPFTTIEYDLTTTEKYIDELFKTSTKPMIVLYLNKSLITRTIDSWENFDKNIEFFEKMAKRYHKVISFTKFIYTKLSNGKYIPADDVCNWTFYKKGKRYTKLCTTLVETKPTSTYFTNSSKPQKHEEKTVEYTVYPPNKETIYEQILSLLDQVLAERELECK